MAVSVAVGHEHAALRGLHYGAFLLLNYRAFVALSWTEHAAPAEYDEAHRRMSFTADFWHDWLAHGDVPDQPWRTYLQRSALTLKGLTYAPTGAMCAASTTSLPETPGGRTPAPAGSRQRKSGAGARVR
mgnify:CR=1 FL=1